MTLALVRVDDRLVHGQVVEGWLRVIQADRVVVVCDRAAADPLQKGMMRLALPDEVMLDVWPVTEALREWPRLVDRSERVLVLLPGIKELRTLVEGGAVPPGVNLGGVHDGPGRRPVTANLFLSDEDRSHLAVVLDRRVAVETRALPGDAVLPMEAWWAPPPPSKT